MTVLTIIKPPVIVVCPQCETRGTLDSQDLHIFKSFKTLIKEHNKYTGHRMFSEVPLRHLFILTTGTDSLPAGVSD